MWDVMKKGTKEVVFSSRSLVEAMKEKEKRNQEQGFDLRLTGIGIVCEYAVKSLNRSELNYLLDTYGNIFSKLPFDKKENAFRVSNELYEEVSEAVGYYIIQENNTGK